jgi:hypothetical protein
MGAVEPREENVTYVTFNGFCRRPTLYLQREVSTGVFGYK